MSSKFFKMILVKKITVALVFVLVYQVAFAQQNLKVLDGDTIDLQGKTWRIHGIDAPELQQFCSASKKNKFPCGYIAKQRLEEFVKNHTVTCKKISTDKYKRNIGCCSVLIGKKSIDLGRYMVKNGWAMAYKKYSMKYSEIEKVAKINKKGFWNSTFERPWSWRHRKQEQKSFWN